MMKTNERIAKVVLGLFLGSTIALAIFFFFPGNVPSPAPSQHPLFVLINMDNMQNCTVEVTISGSGGRTVFEKSYTLAPGEKRESEILAGKTPEEYAFSVRAMGKDVSNSVLVLGPTNVAILEIIPGNRSAWVSYSLIDLTSVPSRI